MLKRTPLISKNLRIFLQFDVLNKSVYATTHERQGMRRRTKDQVDEAANRGTTLEISRDVFSYGRRLSMPLYSADIQFILLNFAAGVRRILGVCDTRWLFKTHILHKQFQNPYILVVYVGCANTSSHGHRSRNLYLIATLFTQCDHCPPF